MHGSYRARGDRGDRSDGSNRQRLVLVQFAAAKRTSVFAKAVINQFARRRVVVRVILVAYRTGKRFCVKSAVRGDFCFSAPLNVVVLDGVDVPSALRLLRRVRLFWRPLPSWLDDLFRLVARVGKYAEV